MDARPHGVLRDWPSRRPNLGVVVVVGVTLAAAIPVVSSVALAYDAVRWVLRQVGT